MKRRYIALALSLTLVLGTLAACGGQPAAELPSSATTSDEGPAPATLIELSDNAITVGGEPISKDTSAAVYAANDIVFYLAGQDFTYGEGSESDAHTQDEADAHTVVHITEPGRYTLRGKLSAGQIAVDLGEEAKNDPEAVVTLYLDGADITCTVAPAVIFYNVYECGSTDAAAACKDVDTSAAGANVVIADGSTNRVNGSYVARIYKSYTLSEDGTEVVDSKKLHKYDAAFYSKMSMNVTGGPEGSGVLHIDAENEGLDSELHLTINGGIIKIESGNDGINTNEDNVSVTTVNGGELYITVTGETGEGDGIDSNGWIVINGGRVHAFSCPTSADSGIDADMGIHLNGGEVVATLNMLDRITANSYAVFSFASRQTAGSEYTLKNANGDNVLSFTAPNDFSAVLISSNAVTAGTYTFYADGKQLEGAASTGFGGMGFGGMGFAGGMGEMPEMPEIPEMPEGGKLPEGFEPPEGFGSPNGFMQPAGEPPFGRGEGRPEGMGKPGFGGGRPDRDNAEAGELSSEFVIAEGANYFSSVSVIGG